MAALLCLMLLVILKFIQVYEGDFVHEDVSNRAQAISRLVASNSKLQDWMARSPLTPEGLEGIQRYSEQVRLATGVEFIVIFDNHGKRLSHPNPAKIGLHIQGADESGALRGEEYISVSIGTLGESIRAFTPIFHDGRQVGAVVTGITTANAKTLTEARMTKMLGGISLVFLVGFLAIIIFSRKLKKTLLGMEPEEIALQNTISSTVLKSVREGVLVIDAAGRLQVVNDQARKILAKAHLPSDVLGQPVDKAIPHTRLLEVVRTGRAENDAEQNLGGVVIITNRVPLVVSGKIMGALATFRDLSDMMELAEELTGAKKWIEALRVRAHNYRNTLHVINGLVKNQQYPELERYVEELRIADEVHNGRIARLIKDQVLAAFLQSKVARAAELGIELDVEPDSHADEIPDAPFRQALLSVVGNLLDNAMDAVNESEDRCVRIRITSGQPIWAVEVSDSGCGFKGDPMQYFRKGVTTKGEGHGYGLYLVARAVHAYNGSIEIESNYPAGTVLKIVMQAAGPE